MPSKKRIADLLSNGKSAQSISDLIKQTRQPFWNELPIETRIAGLVVIVDSLYNLLYAYGLCVEYNGTNKRHGTERKKRRKKEKILFVES